MLHSWGYLFHVADEDSGKCYSSESETGTQIILKESERFPGIFLTHVSDSDKKFFVTQDVSFSPLPK